MIKTIDISLGQVGALSVLDLPAVGVPVVEPGVVLASGYYKEQTTGQLYYYDARNDQWYYCAAGLLYPLSISWKPSPSARIDLVAGDTLRMYLSFYYKGPQVTRRFYAAIGTNSKSGSFDEWLGFNNSPGKDITIPAKTTWTLITGNFVDIKIPTGEPLWGHSGEVGAAYCKILDGLTLTEGVNCTPYYYDVCYIVPAAGEFSSFGITSFVKA